MIAATESRAASDAPRRPRILFVGERRSATARRRDWTWRDGRLAARPLFEALRALGVDPTTACDFINLWTDGEAPAIPRQRVSVIRGRASPGATIVALGRRVQGELARLGIAHVALVHPAARGRIRRRDRYVAHVREVLGPRVLGSPPAGGVALAAGG